MRVDIASDSISGLKPGEAKRWDASVYSDEVERRHVRDTLLRGIWSFDVVDRGA